MIADQPTERRADPGPLVVVPTLDEEANISKLLDQLEQAVSASRVLVVDHSASRRTVEAIERWCDSPGRRARVEVIREPHERGLGRAYRTGFLRALELDHPHVVQMDADLSHDPAQVAALVAELADHDLVIGSRYLADPAARVVGWPRHRLLLSHFGNWYARRATALPFRDLTSGFKAYRRDALARLEPAVLRSDGYLFQIECVQRAHRAGLRIAEAPIAFRERHAGESKLSGKVILEAALGVWRLDGGRS